MSAATSASQEGKCPIPGVCERKCTCMMEAPASYASCADCAISAGVTGIMGCCRGSVSTPLRAQVMIALSIADPSFFHFANNSALGYLTAFGNRQAPNDAVIGSCHAGLHFHGFDKGKCRPCAHRLFRLYEQLRNRAGHRRSDKFAGGLHRS